eukprot:1404311-Ditylum_brightwellii.AAC.1
MSNDKEDVPKESQDPRTDAIGEEENKMPLSPTKSKAREYDFYAPPGSLGVVIESTPRGPCLHNIYSKSPLLGIVGKGDYIIAVDDDDTTELSAAELTCLLAMRSEQPQRKLTLVSCSSRTKY